MVSTGQLRQALGPTAEGRSDEELARINGLMERLAGTLFEGWRKQLATSNNTVGKTVAYDTI